MTMVLQHQSLHMLLQIIDRVDFGVCQLKALDVCLGGSIVGLTRSLGPSPSGEGWSQLSRTRGDGQDQLSQR